MPRLSGKVALITGAASGFGAAGARLFAAEGARVLLADLDAARAGSVAREIGEAAAFLRCDHTSAADCAAAVEAARSRWGRLDILWNNAGIGWAGAFTEAAEEDAARVMAVDLLGPVLMTRAALPLLLAGAPVPGPAVLFTASGLGLRGGPRVSLYAAAKHGVVGLMRSLAAELGPQGLRVNAVCRGIIETPAVRAMWGEGTEAALAHFRSGNLVPWPVRVEDVARAALFLVSDEARGITSVALPVDAGRHGV
jgi:3-oxoacyl-[acyl-carrier protein] reductase